MNILDYFFYVLVNGQMKVLRKDEWYSIISAAVIIAMLFSWFIISAIFSIGLIAPYRLADIIANNKSFHMLTYVITGLLPLIHYWRYECSKKLIYSNIVDKRNSMNKHLRTVYYTLFLLSIVGIPILYFATARLYTFGQVKWW